MSVCVCVHVSVCEYVRISVYITFIHQRRDYRILAESLPPKYEYVVNIRMSPLQEELIKRYLERNSGYHTATDLFSTFANLLKVHVHVYTLSLHVQCMYIEA